MIPKYWTPKDATVGAIRVVQFIGQPALWHQEGFWNGKLADEPNLTGEEVIGKDHELAANPYRAR